MMTISDPLTTAEEATETVKITRAEVRQAEADTQVAAADLAVAAPPAVGKKLFCFFTPIFRFTLTSN